MLFNAHPTGANQSAQRLDALMAEGGIQVCGNAQNCVAVCPKKIPLTTSIAKAGRELSERMIASPVTIDEVVLEFDEEIASPKPLQIAPGNLL